MAKSSINFKRSSRGSFIHNDRSERPDYLLPEKHRQKNECDRSAKEANALLDKLFQEARSNYGDKFNQKLQARSYVHEAVVNLNKEHTLNDVKKLVADLERETGFTCVQASIHRDEGRVEERESGEVAIHNYHAHLVFFTLDRHTGQQLYRKQVTEKQKQTQPELKPFNRARMSMLQDITARALSMQRGKHGSKAVRKDHKQYREAKQREAKFVKKAAEIVSQKDAKIKDLKKISAELRAELRSAGATREAYAKLEDKMQFWRKLTFEKQLTVDQLKEQANALREKLKEGMDLAKKQKTAIEALEAQKATQATTLREKTAQIAILEREIKEKDVKISKLEAALEKAAVIFTKFRSFIGWGKLTEQETIKKLDEAIAAKPKPPQQIKRRNYEEEQAFTATKSRGFQR